MKLESKSLLFFFHFQILLSDIPQKLLQAAGRGSRFGLGARLIRGVIKFGISAVTLL